MEPTAVPERTGWFRRQHWLVKIVLVAVVAYALFCLSFLAMGTDNANAATLITNPANLATASEADLNYTISSTATPPTVIDAILRGASIEETSNIETEFGIVLLAPSFPAGTDITSVGSYVPAGCHGRIWRKQRVYYRGINVTVAWRRTAIDRWCANTRGQIYDWGTATGDDGKWSAGPFCWYDATFGKAWWTVSKSEAKVWNQGTMKACGRVSPQVTIQPRIYFHGSTLRYPYLHWNFGGTKIYH